MPFGVGGLYIGESDILGLGPEFFTQSVGVAQNRLDSVFLDSVTCLNNYLVGIFYTNITNFYVSNCHFDGTFCDDPNLFAIGAAGGNDQSYENPSVVNAVVENSTFNNPTNVATLLLRPTTTGVYYQAAYLGRSWQFRKM